MSYIIATSSSFPPNYYRQEDVMAAMRFIWPEGELDFDKVERFFQSVQVDGRYLALPLEKYVQLTDFGSTNQIWMETSLELGEQAVNRLLEQCHIAADQIDLFIFISSSGLAVPSIDARLMNRIPFSTTMKRMPLVGLGCMGGAAGIARAADYLKGHPNESAVVLSIELNSLTFQKDDLSVANLISGGLFGDGAAAVLMAGNQHPLARHMPQNLPRVVETRSVFFPDTEDLMGWEVRSSGLKVILSPKVPEVTEEGARDSLTAFLRQHGLSAAKISHWIAHPGGPKVIEALGKGLQLDLDAFQLSLESLASVGNTSSASVLLILGETLKRYRPDPGEYGVLLALGPAFSAEYVLLQW